MRTSVDPREIITPATVTVAPELLGLPLARPWRRGVAILIDLLLCAILVGLLEAPSVFLSVVATVIVWRLLRRGSGDPSALRRIFRFSLHATLALLTFALCVALFTEVGGWVRARSHATGGNAGRPGLEMSLLGTGITLAESAALFRAESPEQAKAVADRIRDRLIAAGLDAEAIVELRAALDEIAADSQINPVAIAAMHQSLAEVDTTTATAEDAAPPPSPETLAHAYTSALNAGDTVRAAALRAALTEALAGEQIAELERDNRRLSSRIERLTKENTELEERRASITALMRNTLEDFGLKFGWLMLYFVGFTVLWQGRTPGKRLLGIRAIRLDGRPIGWWVAFERFSGYSVAIVTGLAGFAQIYWDRNRQTIQDRIAGTVVIYERGRAPVPTVPDVETPGRPREDSATEAAGAGSEMVSATQQAARGTEPAAYGALDRRGDQVIPGEGQPIGQPGGIETREVAEVPRVEEGAAFGESEHLRSNDASTEPR